MAFGNSTVSSKFRTKLEFRRNICDLEWLNDGRLWNGIVFRLKHTLDGLHTQFKINENYLNDITVGIYLEELLARYNRLTTIHRLKSFLCVYNIRLRLEADPNILRNILGRWDNDLDGATKTKHTNISEPSKLKWKESRFEQHHKVGAWDSELTLKLLVG